MCKPAETYPPRLSAVIVTNMVLILNIDVRGLNFLHDIFYLFGITL